MKREPIYVVGYPKSGNTWLSRLLGDVLNSPVSAFKNAKPLCEEGQNRPGPYVIHQVHLKMDHSGFTDQPLVPNAWRFNAAAFTDQKVVHIFRDPRDVIISAHFYWQRSDLWDSVRAVVEGNHPLQAHGSWQSFVEPWIDFRRLIPIVFYEQLLKDPYLEMATLAEMWQIASINLDRLEKAIDRQSFSRIRQQIQKDGEDRPYGKETQLRNLRKGIAGDWRNHLNRAQGEYIHKRYWPLLAELGYEDDPAWWQGLK